MEVNKYDIDNAFLEMIGIVDNLLSIIKRQSLNAQDFDAAKAQFEKFSAIGGKLNNGVDIVFSNGLSNIKNKKK